MAATKSLERRQRPKPKFFPAMAAAAFSLCSVMAGGWARADANKTAQPMWLPIYMQGNHLIAIGNKALPQAFILPSGLHPFARALIQDTGPKSRRLWIVQLFFPATEETAVMHWAQSPLPAMGTGHRFRWTFEASTHSARTYRIKTPPTSPPWGWFVGRVGVMQGRKYNIDWQGRQSDPATDKVFHSEYYGAGSPIKNAARQILVGIVWTEP